MLIKAKKESYVTKSEKLLKARYELNEVAIKLIAILYSNVKRSDEIGKDYEMRVEDISKLLNKDYGELYNEIKKAVEELMSNPVFIPDDDNPKNYVAFNWISDAKYKNGTITFTISKQLKPFILDLQEKFLKYKLENILPLRSVYVIRLYEILKDWYEKSKRYGNKAEKIIKVDELREMLEIPKSYRFNDVKRFVLNKSKKELEEHTDIIFDFEEIKTGRRVTHLKIIIQDNPKKIQEIKPQEKPYLKSFKTFTDYLRKKYAGNQKTFFSGKDTKTGKITFFGINNDYLLYGFVPGEMETTKYNSLESMQKYEKFYQVVKNSELFQDLIEGEVDLYEVFKENRELFNIMQQEVNEILNSKDK